jgi:L-aspartate oxidase
MTEHAGIVRTNAGLEEASATIEQLCEQYRSARQAPFASYPLETWNLLRAARHVVLGAIERKENVGLHFNSDLV